MKKTISIIIIIFLLLLGGVAYYLYINKENPKVDSGTIFNNVKNFLPFGKPQQNIVPVEERNNSTSTENTNTQPIKTERMFQISSTPTSGYVAIDRTSTSSEFYFNKEKNATTSTTTKKTDTFVRYMERASGHIYEFKTLDLEKGRISNNTIPKVYETYFNASGTAFITRTLSGENIITEYIKINSASSTETLSNPVLYPFNTDIVIVRGDNVFYTTKNYAGSVGFVTPFDNKKPTQIFSTQLREISGSWDGGNIMEIFSKPNSQIGGISFVIDIKKKTIKESLSGILGLTTNPNNDGSSSLYNTNIDDLSLGSKIGSTNTAIYLKTKTLPEKCVWSKKNTKIVYCAVPVYIEKMGYPEKWYQGVVSFNDDFWRVNTETGEQTLVYRPTVDGKAPPDAISLSLNEKENF